MRLIIPLIFVTLLAPAASAQKTTCELGVERAPEIRGFRLNQTIDEVKSRYPAAKYPKANDLGMIDPVIIETVEGVRYVILSLIDGKVGELSVYYDDSVKWGTAGQLSDKLADSFKLPAWWDIGGHPDERRLTCKGFVISAGLVTKTVHNDGSYIKLQTADYEDTVSRRIREEEQKKREGFQP